jgi:hypothetical protein
VTGWRAAGDFRTQGNAETNSVLSIWRERSGRFERIDGIELQLGICGSEDPTPSVPGMSGVYECTLPDDERVSVQPGDVVGIELPARNRAVFQLYFDNTNNGPTNYVFGSPGSNFSLSDAISNEQASDQPQITLIIEPVITTTTPALPTTQAIPATTEALSTMADPPTTTPPLTSTSMATTELPASTEASITNSMAATTQLSTSTEDLTTAAATDPHATTTGSPTTTTAVTTSVDSESTTAGSTTSEIPSSATIDAQTPSGDEAVQQREGNTGTIAGAAVGAIIAVLLVLIIVLLLVLVLRRQTRNGQKFTPSNNATIVNPVYDGKPIVPNLEGVFH